MSETINTKKTDWSEPEPNEKRMGWTIDHLQPAQMKLIEEQASQEDELFCEAADASSISDIDDRILEIVKSHFKFDDGMNLLVFEQLVYQTTFMIDQNMGNCVGNSHVCLVANRIAVEILGFGQLEEPLDVPGVQTNVPFIPYSYGVGRHMAGFRGNSDGSTCSGQIQGTQKYGFLPCYTPGLENYSGTLPQCSSSVGKKFGRNFDECEKWLPHAKQFDLLEAPRARTAEDAKHLVCEKLISLQICSGWGFKYDGFDSHYGVHLYRPSGRWAHSMQVVAMFEIKGQWFTVIRNQWGKNQHKGSPEIDIPGGCMVIPIETFDRWIRDSVTFGIGEIQGLATTLDA